MKIQLNKMKQKFFLITLYQFSIYAESYLGIFKHITEFYSCQKALVKCFKLEIQAFQAKLELKIQAFQEN